MIKNEIREVFSKGNIKEYRKFGITMSIIFGLISAFLFWKTKVSASYILVVCIGFVLFGLFVPKALKFIYLVWMGFAVVMGFVMSRVILSLLFFILFTPVGIVTRLLRKDLLKENWETNARSYWITRERKPYDPKSAEHQY